MKIRALVSFAGQVTMAIREEKEVPNEIAKDLIQAGHAVEVKTQTKRVKANEN